MIRTKHESVLRGDDGRIVENTKWLLLFRKQNTLYLTKDESYGELLD
jgi:hypothetical protein